MRYPIFVPSKGRPHTCTTPDLLNREEIFFYLVIEPQDEEAYRDVPGEKLILPENDMGNGYVHRFIQRNTKGFAWYIDDDIQSMVELVQPKTPYDSHLAKRSVAYCLLRMEALLEDTDKDRIFMAGASYIQSGRAWNPEPFKWNRNVGNLYLGSSDDKWNLFDERWKVRAECKFLVSNLIENQGNSLLFNHFLFRTAPLGGNEGGCKKFYEEGLSHFYIDQVVAAYPEYCKKRITETGDAMLRFNWRKIDELFDIRAE